MAALSIENSVFEENFMRIGSGLYIYGFLNAKIFNVTFQNNGVIMTMQLLQYLINSV